MPPGADQVPLGDSGSSSPRPPPAGVDTPDGGPFGLAADRGAPADPPQDGALLESHRSTSLLSCSPTWGSSPSLALHPQVLAHMARSILERSDFFLDYVASIAEDRGVGLAPALPATPDEREQDAWVEAISSKAREGSDAPALLRLSPRGSNGSPPCSSTRSPLPRGAASSGRGRRARTSTSSRRARSRWRSTARWSPRSTRALTLGTLRSWASSQETSGERAASRPFGKVASPARCGILMLQDGVDPGRHLL